MLMKKKGGKNVTNKTKIRFVNLKQITKVKIP